MTGRNVINKAARQTSEAKPRSRPQVRSSAARKPVLHVVMPGMEVARAEPKPRETVSAFLRRAGWATKDRKYGWQFKKGLPTVLEVNGEPLLRRFWSTKRIAANDNLRFVSYPLGGQGSGAKQVIGLVALIAVSAFASLVVGPAVAAEYGSVAGWGATAAVGVGGALMVNTLERKPNVSDQCSDTEVRGARHDGWRRVSSRRDDSDDWTESEPYAAPVMRGSVPWSCVGKAILAELIGLASQSFDDLKALIAPLLQEASMAYAPLFEECQSGPDFEVVVAGWSDAGPAAYMVASHNRHGEPWAIIPLSGLCITPANPTIHEQMLAALPDGSTEESLDPEADGVRILNIQRRWHIENDGFGDDGKFCAVGGFAQLTTVTADAVTTRVIHRWPDLAGAPIATDCGVA